MNIPSRLPPWLLYKLYWLLFLPWIIQAPGIRWLWSLCIDNTVDLTYILWRNLTELCMCNYSFTCQPAAAAPLHAYCIDPSRSLHWRLYNLWVIANLYVQLLDHPGWVGSGIRTQTMAASFPATPWEKSLAPAAYKSLLNVCVSAQERRACYLTDRALD